MNTVLDITTDPCCDFCDEPVEETCRSFKAVDFVSHTTMSISEGPWAACPECATLVDAGDWPGLAKRSTAMFERKYGPNVMPLAMVEETMRELHDEFRRAML